MRCRLWNGVQLGVPINGNLYVWMTRKDLIENPACKTQFKAKYGYELAIPKTFKELLEMGTFFYENNIAADPKGVFSMFIWPAQIAAYEDPTKSLVAGKIAYSAPPAGPAGQAAVTGAWAIAIPMASRPRFKEIGQVQDVVKKYWVQGITGAMPTKDAVQNIVKETNDILKKAGC